MKSLLTRYEAVKFIAEKPSADDSDDIVPEQSKAPAFKD